MPEYISLKALQSMTFAEPASSKPLAMSPLEANLGSISKSLTSQGRTIERIDPLDGMAQPYAILPVKSRTLNLPDNHTSYGKSVELIQALKLPESDIVGMMKQLLAWTGLEKASLATSTQVIPVCGNVVVAAGLAASLLHPDASQPVRKIALIEWGQPEASLLSVLDPNAPTIGLSELFNNQCDLTHLFLNAKVHRLMPQLYVIGQGNSRIDPMKELERLSQLMSALSKKFHRIVLNLPSYEQEPHLPEMLMRLRLNYGLFYDPDDTILLKLHLFRAIWQNSIIQRLT